MAKRAGKKSKKESVSTGTVIITLRASKKDICSIESSTKLQQQAMRWSYIVRQRHRWSQQQSTSDEIKSKAERTLIELGVTEAHLEELARAEVIEVRIPYESEGTAWEARVMPWEFMLSAATKRFARGARPLVVRHIDCKSAATAATASPEPRQLVIAVCDPGTLGEQYTFSGEVQLVTSTLYQFKKPVIADNPDVEELKKTIAAAKAPIVHIAGVDAHQGAALLNDDESNAEDGLYIGLDDRGQPNPVTAVRVAEILNVGKDKPALVSFNVWDSGARLAPLAVAQGANAAIGFEHTIDDSIAELFFSTFYRVWSETKYNLLAAFREAMNAIKSYGDRMRGSSIVLCSATSLVTAPAVTKTAVGKFRDADPTTDRVDQLVRVDAAPNNPLNYALLHNRRSLMSMLKLIHLSPETIDAIRGIDVFVQLNVGADSFPYRTRLNLRRTTSSVDLANKDLKAPRTDFVAPDHQDGGIYVPLTSALARSVDESMQTSVYVDVTWHDQVIYRHTHTVRLAPVDEWRFTDQDVIWLPSFIQPRDPAVHAIIAAAQRYLKCLADYPSAGFDGYQSFDADAGELSEAGDGVEVQINIGREKLAKAAAGIDLQVRAIWAALLQDYQLNYINPPPSYSENAQRLRTPRDVLQQGRGTCIDLAVLLASCLEWIEVYPVIFMLQDHAFPGYWRSEQAYLKFREMSELDGAPLADGRRTGASRSVENPWVSDRTAYEEIRGYVERGELVPLETVGLTASTSFAEAIAEAEGYFRLKRNRNFHSMVDIVLSRENQVTPLPLCSDAFTDGLSREKQGER